MKYLSDGTPIRAQEEAIDSLRELLDEAIDINDQEALVEIKGYVSKTSKNKANITLNLVYDYPDLLEEALEHVQSFPVSEYDTKIASKTNWRKAKSELIESLNSSLRQRNPRDNISRAAESIFDFLPTVLVGLSSGLIQFRGIITKYKLIN